jgi:hypothetical protein
MVTAGCYRSGVTAISDVFAKFGLKHRCAVQDFRRGVFSLNGWIVVAFFGAPWRSSARLLSKSVAPAVLSWLCFERCEKFTGVSLRRRRVRLRFAVWIEERRLLSDWRPYNICWRSIASVYIRMIMA